MKLLERVGLNQRRRTIPLAFWRAAKGSDSTGTFHGTGYSALTNLPALDPELTGES